MVLLIDNYDSFTFNLYHYILQCNQSCKVIKNDELTLEEIHSLSFNSIVISPGPKTPESAGVTNQIIQTYWNKLPILGICLGHQALGCFFGAKLIKAPLPVHGKTSVIKLYNHPVFENMEEKISVMRYHSLILEEVENHLVIIAETDDNQIMALAHQKLPLVGLQFHPESILTSSGLKIMKNWFNWINA